MRCGGNGGEEERAGQWHLEWRLASGLGSVTGSLDLGTAWASVLEHAPQRLHARLIAVGRPGSTVSRRLGRSAHVHVA